MEFDLVYPLAGLLAASIALNLFFVANWYYRKYIRKMLLESGILELVLVRFNHEFVDSLMNKGLSDDEVQTKVVEKYAWNITELFPR